ncbi:hypothetical protein PV350_02210 [Streptomyces sp. PA03-6a]|nr:hypothetical protein [Streptomyces sp. PA03-6a]
MAEVVTEGSGERREDRAGEQVGGEDPSGQPQVGVEILSESRQRRYQDVAYDDGDTLALPTAASVASR